jgi:hypothetical protein
MSDIDFNNIEIDITETYSVFQGKVSKILNVKLVDKLTDEEYYIFEGLDNKTNNDSINLLKYVLDVCVTQKKEFNGSALEAMIDL